MFSRHTKTSKQDFEDFEGAITGPFVEELREKRDAFERTLVDGGIGLLTKEVRELHK